MPGRPQKKAGGLFILLTLSICCSSYGYGKETQSSTKHSATKLYGQVDIIGSACAAVGIKLSNSVLPAKIDVVRLGSAAYYSGVSKNDRVLSAKVENNFLNMVIERNGKKYSARLDTAPQTRSRALPTGATQITAETSSSRFGVFVCMGLCGSWDEQGTGRQRWETLLTEIDGNSALANDWQDWRETIRLKIKDLAAAFANDKGPASVHVDVAPDGSVTTATVYAEAERPEEMDVDLEASRKLLALLTKIKLPPYPRDSKAKEAHILIFARTGLAKELDKSSAHAHVAGGSAQ